MRRDSISFNSPAGLLTDITDEQLLRRLGWRKSGDIRLRGAAETGDLRQFALALSRNLNAGKLPRRRKESTPPLLQLLWSRHAFEPADRDPAAFLTELQRTLTGAKSAAKMRSRLCRIVARELDAAPMPDRSPLAPLQWITVLEEVGALLPPDLLFTLWRTSLEASLAATSHSDVLAPGHGAEPPDDRRLLVQGELPWRVGLCFRDLRGAGKVMKAGRSCLREGLEALTDGDGMPHAASLHRLPLTLATFVRSMHAAQTAQEKLWDSGSAERFESLIVRAASLCRADGSISLSNGASFAPASLLRTASQLAGLPKHEPSVQRLLALPHGGPSRQTADRKRNPLVTPHKRKPRFDESECPSSQSDWAELACLRNNWLLGADSCIVAHHQSPPQISLNAFECPLLDGPWPVEFLRDGKPIDLDNEWSCVCWHSDEDADYLELQLDGDGATLCRQVMLSRTDHWLFAADAVVTSQAGTLELTTRLPLADGVKAESNRWSRELRLSQHKLKATVYPLALDQQRVIHPHGLLEEQGGELVLKQRGQGTGVYAPLVIDWSPARRRHPAQWRRLTVAEDGVILGADTAAGFRLRVGRHQWLFYRSLRAGETARTVLGHHTAHESVIAEFTADGNVEPLVMVE